MDNIEKIPIAIVRIVTPSEFYIQFTNSIDALDDQNANFDQHMENNNIELKKATSTATLSSIRDRDVRKCHLAFLAPTSKLSWSLAAIDKFQEYCERFVGFAVTIPQWLISSSQSTGVILWGLELNISETDQYLWRNINLKMIFQGVALHTIHINFVDCHFMESMNVSSEMNNQQMDANIIDNMNKKSMKIHQRWLPSQLPRSKEFTGIPVYINSDLLIYVQQDYQQKCVAYMSNTLTKWHQKRNSTKKSWYRNDICSIQGSDGMFHRGIVKKIRNGHSLVRLVDFGYNELVTINRLSAHIEFMDVPIQVIKCHLFNTKILPHCHMKVKNLCEKMIIGENCSFFIHDHLASNINAIFCDIRPLNASFDIVTRLISHNFVKRDPNYKKLYEMNQEAMEKRYRKQSDVAVLIDSSELQTIDDFQQFYETKKAIIPPINTDDSIDDHIDHELDIFERPSKRCALDKSNPIEHNFIINQSHHLLDQITRYFTLLPLTESNFHCRVLYIIDPVTILITPIDVNPQIIEPKQPYEKSISFEEKSPCIAFLDGKWLRGIVSKKISTNKYMILFVDTMKIVEILRILIRKCPRDVIGSTLPLAKVYLSKIAPNKRLREGDVCDALSKIVLDLDLSVAIVGYHFCNTPLIKLYVSDNSKYTIYDELIRKNFYKKLK